MKLNEAFEEIRSEYDDAMVITSDYDRPLDEMIDVPQDQREVWVEWGEVIHEDVRVPATHVFFLDEDGYMLRDGSGFAIVSALDYALLGR